MAYEKNTWQTGDVVTAQKLNNMENGIEGTMPLTVTFTNNEGTIICDKTLEEIYHACQNGRVVIGKQDYAYFHLTYCGLLQEESICAEFSGVEYIEDGVDDGYYFALIHYSENSITRLGVKINL